MKTEYLYYDLGRVSYITTQLSTNALGFGISNMELVRSSVRYDGHIVRLGLNYHFATPATPIVARY